MDELGSVEIVIKGGRPWGFTLQGGIESRSALTIAQIEPKGKAAMQGALKVGDHVLKINDVQCFSLADATQLIDCAFRTLTVLVWRSKSTAEVSKGPIKEITSPENARHFDKYLQEKAMIKTTSGIVSNRISNANSSSFRAKMSSTKNQKSPDKVTLTCDSHGTGLTKIDPKKSDNRTNFYPSYENFTPSSAISSSSSSGTEPSQVVVFQTNDVPSRHSRSPRNLTKDSGYETSAQGDHDYVNVEWFTNTQQQNHVSLPSPPNCHVPKKSPSSTKTTPATWDESQEQYTRLPEKHQDYANQYFSLDNSSYGNDVLSVVTCVPQRPNLTKHADSYSSLYSSAESLSSAAGKQDYAPLRPSKSSLSIANSSSQAPVVPSKSQHDISLCQDLTVSSAQSTPNLNCSEDMVSPRFGKKLSVYEELASRSGLDFSPMVQRHTSWAYGRNVKENLFYKQRHQPQSYSPDYSGPQSLPINCEVVKPRVHDKKYASPENNVDTTVDCNMSYSLPPPVPVRDSSLRYYNNPAHEKFPSWPVSVPEDRNETSSQHNSGYRSNSWTEQSKYPKGIKSYSRPKKHYQITTQQLHPVQEKVKKGRNPSNLQSDLSYKEEAKYNSVLSTNLDLVSNQFNFDNMCQQKRSNASKYSIHSPPERDTSSKKDQSRTPNQQFYPQESDRVNHNWSQSSGIYENVRKCGNNQINTPLLDRLRLESGSLPQSWLQKDSDVVSETGTYLSNSSSQETLKWHDSYSDLSSLHTSTRYESPVFDSDTSTMYDEQLNFDCSEKSFSTHSKTGSLSESSFRNASNRKDQKQLLPTPDTGYRSSEDSIYANEIIRNYGMKDSRCGLRTSNSLQSFRSIDESEDTRNYSYPVSPSYFSRPRGSSGGHMDQGINTNMKRPVKLVYSESISVTNTHHKGYSHIGPSSPSPNKLDYNKKVFHRQDTCSSKYTPDHREQADGNNLQSSTVKNRRSSSELKAIQKQAVLSFYHRQTSKDSSERKSRSSSFSSEHSSSALSTASPTSQADQAKMSSNSFCYKGCTDTAQTCNSSVGSNFQTNIMDSNSRFNNSVQSTTNLASEPSQDNLTPKQIQSEPKPVISKTDTKPTEAQDEVVTHQEISRSQPESTGCLLSDSLNEVRSQRTHKRSFQLHGRKAFIQKSYNTSDTSTLKVISCQGKTVAKVVVNDRSYFEKTTSTKPQVPPNALQKDTAVPIPNITFYSESSEMPHQDDKEDEELQAITNSIQNQLQLSDFSHLSSSPDLPLPPPPLDVESEVLPSDEPLPPPPTDLPDFLSVANNFVPTAVIFTQNYAGHSNSVNHSSNQSTEEDTQNPCQPSYSDQSYIISKKDDLSEAIYVNLDFRKRMCQNLLLGNSPKPFTKSHSANLISSATQTSDATPSLQRKCNAKNVNESGNESKGETPKHFTTVQMWHMTYGSPNDNLNSQPGINKTTLDNNDNESRINISKKATVDPTDQSNNRNPLRDDLELPLTSPYFTTSEPKAKLLTRYCRSFHEDHTNTVELTGQKDELIESISKKLNILRLEQIELKEEVKQNEELGKEVTAKIEKLAKPNELQKYKIHVEELEKIINLLLSLSGRLARAENALLILPENAKTEEKSLLEAKRNKLSQQHDEAWHLKENIDRRSFQVALFLHHYLSKEEYADYEHFIKMKSKLLMDARELDEKIKLGEEQLAALQGTFQLHINGEKEIKTNAELATVTDKI